MRITYEGNKWPRLQGESIKLFHGVNFDLGKKKNFSIFGVEVIDWPQPPVVPGTVGEYSTCLNLSQLSRATALDQFSLINKLPKPWPTLCGVDISIPRRIIIWPVTTPFSEFKMAEDKPKRKRAPRKKKVKTNV